MMFLSVSFNQTVPSFSILHVGLTHPIIIPFHSFVECHRI